MFHRKALQVSLLAATLFSAAAAATPSGASAEYFYCEVSEVGLYIGSRAHIRCSNSTVRGSNTIRWIAIPSSSSAVAQFLALGKAALLGGKIFAADIPTESTANTPGCAVNDCRTPITFKLQD